MLPADATIKIRNSKRIPEVQRGPGKWFNYNVINTSLGIVYYMRYMLTLVI